MFKLVKCMICGRELHDVGLGTHLKKHNLKINEYYDKYLKTDPLEGICKVCGKPTKFRGINVGYSEYHSSCVAKDSDVQKKKKDNFLKLSIEEQTRKRENKLRKYKETSLEKYGKDNYSKTEEFKIKSESTCLERYGTTHHMKSESISSKFRKEKIKDDTIYAYYCEFCGRGFLSKRAIGSHLKPCNKTTNCREKYFNKYEKIDNFPWNKKIKCKNEKCFKMIWPGGKTGLCHCCSTKNIVKNKSRNAKLTTKNFTFVKNNEVNWECEFCKKIFLTKGELEYHAKNDITCKKLFYDKYRIRDLFPWNNINGKIKFCKCGKQIHPLVESCRDCSNRLLVNKIQLGRVSYQKILDVYNKYYTKKFYDKKFRLIILQEQLICPICEKNLQDIKKESKKIHLHHIDFDKLNDNRSNLVFLCNSCHAKTNWSRIKFKEYLTEFNHNLLNDLKKDVLKIF